MKITIESTTKITHVNGVPARIWEGYSESGIKLHCYITRVAIDLDEPRKEEFCQELNECVPPSAEVKAIPNRLII